ncbi:Flagellar biosynthesis protein FliT [Collimonas arenae]|uniref:Flagellar protein FliT n=1 Tax=Collimonas arenae TaxID=279058 RepID=A0A0A1F6I4_9BURK|nr:flagellar protein FliT [Collimonas arenae]AIY40303.1 Flagellar biosynthesis protein FliT [Collimonas arenae]
MTPQLELMECYEQIAPLTGRMLERARAGDWDALVILGQQFRSFVERLKGIELPAPLEPSQLMRKHNLLSRILADDAEIRDIVAPELAQLSSLLGNMHRQQHLNHAYGQ